MQSDFKKSRLKILIRFDLFRYNFVIDKILFYKIFRNVFTILFILLKKNSSKQNTIIFIYSKHKKILKNFQG